MWFLLPVTFVHKFALCMFLLRLQTGSRKFCTEIWVIALFLFGTVLLAERCVLRYPFGLHVPGLRPPWAASHRVQTLAGARGSWIPLFTRHVDDERYFYGFFQLRRSGGPWFCCSLAMRSCVVLPWSDPAFPQVIESDFTKSLPLRRTRLRTDTRRPHKRTM